MTVDWITELRYSILSILQQHEGLNQGNLSNKIDVGDSTIAKSIDRLEKLELVSRDQNRVYHITQDGEMAVHSLDVIYRLSTK